MNGIGTQSKTNTTEHSVSSVEQVTTQLPDLYSRCHEDFSYKNNDNRVVITKNAIPCKSKNGGIDNDEYDLILAMNDLLIASKNDMYKVSEGLGKGSFGQVVKCRHIKNGLVHNSGVAVKIIKNKPAYYNQALVEIRILTMLNKEEEGKEKKSIVRLLDYFEHHNHLHLVFELLSINLYELIKRNKFEGLSMEYIQHFLVQMLDALQLLADIDVVHCDLKPENILLEDISRPQIRLIDFGSSCFRNQTVYTYIQSRFYRAPEVILGLPYNNSIDIWSLGCIAVELYLGLPLFPGSSEHNQLYRINEMLGSIPEFMLDAGKNTKKFYREDQEYSYFSRIQQPIPKYILKSAFEWAREQSLSQPEKNIRYFKHRSLSDIISCSTTRENDDLDENGSYIYNRMSFLDFIRGLLLIDVRKRWSAVQAKYHPFILNTEFTEKYNPVDDAARMSPRSAPYLSLPSSSLISSPAILGSYISQDGDIENMFLANETADSTSSNSILSPLARPDHPYPLAHFASWDKRKFMNCTSRAAFFHNKLHPISSRDVEEGGSSCPNDVSNLESLAIESDESSSPRGIQPTANFVPYSRPNSIPDNFAFDYTDNLDIEEGGLTMFSFSPELEKMA